MGSDWLAGHTGVCVRVQAEKTWTLLGRLHNSIVHIRCVGQPLNLTYHLSTVGVWGWRVLRFGKLSCALKNGYYYLPNRPRARQDFSSSYLLGTRSDSIPTCDNQNHLQALPNARWWDSGYSESIFPDWESLLQCETPPRDL